MIQKMEKLMFFEKSYSVMSIDIIDFLLLMQMGGESFLYMYIIEENLLYLYSPTLQQKKILSILFFDNKHIFPPNKK